MTPKQFVTKYKKHGSIKAVSRNENITWYQTRKVYRQAVADSLMDPVSVGRKSNADVKKPKPVFAGETQLKEIRTFDVPKRGVRRYIFTSAQNNTKLHSPLWKNLLALAAFYGASVHVGRYTYMKSGLGELGDKAKFTMAKSESLYGADIMAWAPELDDYLNDERCEVAPGLVWCGEWQRLPTVKRPLSGYESYTGRKSGIFPHAKFDMHSVPSSKFEDTKFNYTTGTVTMRNYIVKGAGLQATFHHGYGALLVEVDKDGDWFCRQLNGDSEGTICDWDVMAKGGKVTTGHRIEGLNLGDIHRQEIDHTADRLSAFMMDELNPKYVFYHDLLNFGSRNHHERKNPFKKFERFVNGQEDVRVEVEQAMYYLVNKANRWLDAEHIVVDSNHDRALERWLRESDWRDDPANMLFYMEAAHAKLSAIKEGDNTFHMLRHWWETMIEGAALSHKNIRFLDEDESFVICEDANGGIECGMHGHLGPNGARGSAASFAKMGRKANVGHTHGAGIYDGIYTAGTTSDLDMGYNIGPSSWSHSAVITYENGKRVIITFYNGKCRAGMKSLTGKLHTLKEAHSLV